MDYTTISGGFRIVLDPGDNLIQMPTSLQLLGPGTTGSFVFRYSPSPAVSGVVNFMAVDVGGPSWMDRMEVTQNPAQSVAPVVYGTLLRANSTTRVSLDVDYWARTAVDAVRCATCGKWIKRDSGSCPECYKPPKV